MRGATERSSVLHVRRRLPGLGVRHRRVRFCCFNPRAERLRGGERRARRAPARSHVHMRMDSPYTCNVEVDVCVLVLR